MKHGVGGQADVTQGIAYEKTEGRECLTNLRNSVFS